MSSDAFIYLWPSSLVLEYSLLSVMFLIILYVVLIMNLSSYGSCGGLIEL